MIVENLEQELASQALEKTNFEDRKTDHWAAQRREGRTGAVLHLNSITMEPTERVCLKSQKAESAARQPWRTNSLFPHG